MAAFAVFFAGRAMALSDADHARFNKESSAFAQAEKRLNEVWKQLRKSLSKAEFQRLLEDQRVWINSLRDEEAKAENGTGGDAAAYATVTERRAAVLEGRLEKKDTRATASQNAQKSVEAAPDRPDTAKPTLSRTGASEPGYSRQDTSRQAAPGLEPLPLPAPGGAAGSASRPAAQAEPGIAGVYVKENGQAEVIPSGTSYNVSISAAAPDARWVCHAEGRATLRGNILTLNDRESPELQAVTITVEGDKLIIGYGESELCGAGGTMGGVYVKKKK